MNPFPRVLRCLLVGLLALAGAQAADKLNVLFITADDLGLQVSSYGEKLIQTPNLDKLAASGVRFEVAYTAQASCSPSRSAMFTGLHTHATGQYGLVNGGFELHPHLRDKTIPAYLKRAGYRTGILGKLHVAPEESFPFDVRRTDSAFTRKVREVASEAEKFLKETGDQPFFLMVNYSDPHAFRNADAVGGWDFPPQVDGLPKDPVQPSERTLFGWQGVDTPLQRDRTANYYNAVKRLDDGIGMLMEVLEKAGHRDDTLVIFVSDHGPPFARGKTTTYEMGLRIPYMVRWPGVSKQMASKALVSTVDVLPTILDATGVKPQHEMHGRSLRPVLEGKDAPWRPHLVGEFHFHGATPFFPRRAIRGERFQLIHNILAGKNTPSNSIDGDQAYKTSREGRYDNTDVRRVFDRFANPPQFELYDTVEDPAALHNLAGDPKYKVEEARLKAALEEWRWQTADPFLNTAMLEKMSSHRNPAQ